MPITNPLSNTQNNPRPQVDYYTTNLSTYSHSDQDVVSDQISYLYDRTTEYPTDSIFSQGSKLRIGTNFSTYDLKAP